MHLCAHATDSTMHMHSFLVSNKLEQYEDQLKEQGFEKIKDFKGMTDNRLEKLCEKIGMKEIGIQNRLIREVKNIYENL